MSNKNYYEKYWQPDQNNFGHANKTPSWPQRELDMFYNSIKGFIGTSVLDIGAGEGIFLEYLQKKNNSFKHLAALEISENAIKKGKAKNPLVNYRQGSADEAYPFDDSVFDTIFMTDVLEHLVDVDMALAECYRVLDDKGKIIIIVPVFDLVKRVIISLFFWEKVFYPNNPHIRFFSKKSMNMIMRNNGFKRLFYKWGITWMGMLPQNAYFVYEKR